MAEIVLSICHGCLQVFEGDSNWCPEPECQAKQAGGGAP
jgi:hypothetical protein